MNLGIPELVTTRSAEETRALGARLVEALPGRAVLALHGELGSGKTCLVQGIARALGIRAVVNSPTYTLINEYHGSRPLVHIDLYRVSSPTEALNLGLDEYFERDGITAIEWAERVADLLPAHTLHVHLTTGDRPDTRLVRLQGTNPS